MLGLQAYTTTPNCLCGAGDQIQNHPTSSTFWASTLATELHPQPCPYKLFLDFPLSSHSVPLRVLHVMPSPVNDPNPGVCVQVGFFGKGEGRNPTQKHLSFLLWFTQDPGVGKQEPEKSSLQKKCNNPAGHLFSKLFPWRASLLFKAGGAARPSPGS